jgi:hypothetical protein
VTLLVVCGKTNFTNLSRYGDYSEKTYRRQYQKSFDFIRLNAETIAEAIPFHREQVSAIDCSFIPKSGKTTWGVDSFYNLELHLVSKLRIDANMRYCYTGAQKSRGARRKYDGKVDLNDLSRMEYVGEIEEDLCLYSQVVWHVSLKRKIRIVYLVNTSDPKKTRVALLFSTDINISAESLYAYYKARFQIEFIFRDAKQFTGLCDCQSRNESSLDFHFNVSLAALNIAKYDQLPAQSEDDAEPLSFSMATYKRRAFNQHLLERFISMLDFDLTLIESHPNYQSLLQYGSLTP